VPWTTFTDPELAHVGMTLDDAKKKLGDGKARIHTWDFSHSDRARAESAADGRVMVVTDDRFGILGAHIVASGPVR
jgi:pyruvate/2-oxoglutarate dehydrogenase complex dihydrolipoamide dehydrogenase (E3) component